MTQRLKRLMIWVLKFVRPSAYGELKGVMVGMGDARSPREITHPFVLSKGWSKIELQVSEAEDLRDWLTRQLERSDVRRPINATDEMAWP